MKLALLLSLTALGIFAQRNSDKRMTCDDRNNNSDRARHCHITEQSIPSMSRWTVDSGRNGGISVKGWANRETLVRSKIEAWAPTESEASLIGGQVHSDAAGGRIASSGPESKSNTGWAVSYEIFVPFATDLSLNAVNGGIHLNDVTGRLDFKTVNGGVHISGAGGEVTGSTSNGGIHVELAPGNRNVGAINLKTTNGGVHLTLPSSASAQVRTETVNGGIHSDFPMPTAAGERERNQRPRKVEFNIGSGGPLIQLQTTNGGVHIGKS